MEKSRIPLAALKDVYRSSKTLIYGDYTPYVPGSDCGIEEWLYRNPPFHTLEVFTEVLNKIKTADIRSVKFIIRRRRK